MDAAAKPIARARSPMADGVHGGWMDVGGGRRWRGGWQGGSGGQEIPWCTDRAAGEEGKERERGALGRWGGREGIEKKIKGNVK